MNKFLKNGLFLLTARIILGFVFIYAAISKAAEPESFAIAIANYKLLPDFLINISAIILPWIELCAGLLLLFGISVTENSAILSGLLISSDAVEITVPGYMRNLKVTQLVINPIQYNPERQFYGPRTSSHTNGSVY